MTTGVLVLGAAVWGLLAGLLLPRAAYRFAVPAGEPWRGYCPAGHPVRGWLGGTGCGECGPRASAVRRDPGGTAKRGVPAKGPERGVPGGSAERGVPGGSAERGVPGGSPEPGEPGAGAGAESRQGVPSASYPAPYVPSASHPAPHVPSASHPAPHAPSASHPPPHAPSALLLAAATALVCAALAAATGTRPELAVWLLLAPVGVLLAAVDFRVHRLPDPLTLPLAAAALALLGLAAALPEHAGHWTTALYGALALGAGYYALYRLNPGGMGFGDVKLAVGTGAVLGWYGWSAVLLGTFAGFLLGALYGGVLVLARRADRKSAVPFGPFLLAGALAGLLIGAYAA
ncbi:prepilin peptidase [Streptomyces sp. NPDC015171]|uniref:prepilin peptidase n=1 Tax=Streptomyces sp. NPDC015171 TaxID=3364945 RepID=UPI0036F4E6BD